MNIQSGFYQVLLEDGREITCHARGKLKLRRPETFREDVMAMGDLVLVSEQEDGNAAIEDVLPRERALIRSAPDSRGDFKQILLANPDQVVLVFACAQPEPHLRMLDRFLVICERQQIQALIVANKVDLVGIEQAQEMFSLYSEIGYEVLYTSVKQNLGIDTLREALKDKLSGLVGPSGVGKSSLLNSIQPELGLAVSHVSESTDKGRHTTVTRRLFPLNMGGFVADLPGIRMLSLWDIEPEELDAYFREIGAKVADCQFSNCTHTNEPDCAVKKAVAAGEIHPDRYESYVRMRFGEDD
ncbi:MAG: ribosome small subunit-dependent GTPase A [Chloroflexi bacterium 44-23]|nr:MAG: ribosome small subunit-dependent GTPase A [Chloroflexi bacterium 44-23]